MVLNQVRNRISPVVHSIGLTLGKAGITPNALTAIGFAFSFLAGFLFAYRPTEPYLAALAIIATGVFDVLDGAVARAMSAVSRSGAFNDSTLDRIAEIAIFAGVIYGRFDVPSIIVLLALSFSLLVSYTRAKGESLGIKMSGIGIGERAERLLVLIVFALADFVNIGVCIILILAFVTFIQRFVFINKEITRRGGSKGTLVQ